MRIISDFHDYWDTAYAFGGDGGPVYERRRSTVPAAGRLKESLDRMPQRGLYAWEYRETHMSPVLVVVAGKAHLGFARWNLASGPGTDHVYGADAALSAGGVVLDKGRGIGTLMGRERRHAFNRKGVEAAEADLARADLTAECVALRCPLLAVRYRGDGDRDPVTDLNPCLRDLGFMPVMDAYGLHQEVDMFVSGVLPDAGRPMVTLDDGQRRDKAGFDDWSFRRHRDDPR